MIVGASIAGCAAAIMYAQQGLRIALLDARSDIRAHKVLCTHHLQPCGAPILQRLGATEKLLALGMVETVPTFWTPWGMITPDAAENSPPPGSTSEGKLSTPYCANSRTTTRTSTFFSGIAFPDY